MAHARDCTGLFNLLYINYIFRFLFSFSVSLEGLQILVQIACCVVHISVSILVSFIVLLHVYMCLIVCLCFNIYLQQTPTNHSLSDAYIPLFSWNLARCATPLDCRCLKQINRFNNVHGLTSLRTHMALGEYLQQSATLGIYSGYLD